MWIAFGIIILIIVVYEWWGKTEPRVHQFFEDVKAQFSKAAGYVVVDHILEWRSIKIVEREYFLAGIPEEIIEDHNQAFAIRKKLKLELHYEPDVNIYWKYV